MKYILNIENRLMLLTSERLEAIVTVLDGCECIENKYVGSGKGVNGNSYVEVLAQPRMRDMLKLSVLTDVEHEALRVITKLSEEQK